MPLLGGVSIAILLCMLQSAKDDFTIEIGSPAKSDDDDDEVATLVFACL